IRLIVSFLGELLLSFAQTVGERRQRFQSFHQIEFLGSRTRRGVKAGSAVVVHIEVAGYSLDNRACDERLLIDKGAHQGVLAKQVDNSWYAARVAVDCCDRFGIKYGTAVRTGDAETLRNVGMRLIQSQGMRLGAQRQSLP